MLDFKSRIHHHSIPSITPRVAAQEGDAQSLFQNDILAIP
jgi:hypothetical protein